MNIFQDDQFPTVHDNFSFFDFLCQVYPDIFQQSSLNQDIPQAILTPEILAEEYGRYTSVSYFNLNKESIVVEKSYQLPEKNAYALHALVVKHSFDSAIVGFANPLDQEAVQMVQDIMNIFVTPVMVSQKDLRRMLRLTYRKIDEIKQYANRIVIYTPPTEMLALIDHEDDKLSELAFLIIKDAMEIEASDIHIETSSCSVIIRLRIDGVLQQYALENLAIGNHLVRYFKLLSDVDITQDQRPTEGKKVAIMIGKEDVNMRISFMPTCDGQSVVIRLLGNSDSYILRDRITQLSYRHEIEEYLKRSYGMFLISGPTGSGKTTTLYSAIQEINTPDKKIITLEDPVEAKIPGTNQIQVNETIHYGFADGLRSALRQDPDVIMLGEIRDEITANMAVRAAITGHLVLSTVHARGVAEIPIRLLNLKVDPYLLASALRLMVSQRLVKKICVNCKEVHILSDAEQAFLKKHHGLVHDSAQFYRGKGCHYCQHTGFLQREAVFEILHMTPKMISCLSLNEIAEYMALVDEAMHGRRLLDYAFSLALQGVISLDEVMRLESD